MEDDRSGSPALLSSHAHVLVLERAFHQLPIDVGIGLHEALSLFHFHEGDRVAG